MKKQLRLAILGVSVLAIALAAGAEPAHAYYKHHHRNHIVHAKAKTHKKHSRKASSGNSMVREAQASLINLRYLAGKADGKLGPKTTRAIRNFQKDHGLHADGKLTRATYNAIIKADSERAMAALPVPKDKLLVAPLPVPDLNRDTLAAQPGLVGPTNQQYADPLLGGQTVTTANGSAQAIRTQTLSSRFAKIDINENINGNLRRYNMTVNGNPILQVNNQPSIIGISQTYAFDSEDVMIVTTYRDGDRTCQYKHYLLSLAQGRNELHVLGNCTHGYQARKVEDSLFVTFPEFDDERMAPATWRYENGNLEQL